jgi:hypothetical protein
VIGRGLLVRVAVAARVAVYGRVTMPSIPTRHCWVVKTAVGHRLEVLSIGLRQGEALALRWSDLDLDAPTVKGQQLGDRSPRTYRANAFAADALREHRTRQLEERDPVDAARSWPARWHRRCPATNPPGSGAVRSGPVSGQPPHVGRRQHEHLDS